MEIHGTAVQTTDDNVIRLLRFACWVTNAYKILLLCHDERLYVNAPLYYVISTLSLLLLILSSFHLQEFSDEKGSYTEYPTVFQTLISL
jgi:hypothetical protein